MEMRHRHGRDYVSGMGHDRLLPLYDSLHKLMGIAPVPCPLSDPADRVTSLMRVSLAEPTEVDHRVARALECVAYRATVPLPESGAARHGAEPGKEAER